MSLAGMFSDVRMMTNVTILALGTLGIAMAATAVKNLTNEKHNKLLNESPTVMFLAKRKKENKRKQQQHKLSILPTTT